VAPVLLIFLIINEHIQANYRWAKCIVAHPAAPPCYYCKRRLLPCRKQSHNTSCHR